MAGGGGLNFHENIKILEGAREIISILFTASFMVHRCCPINWLFIVNAYYHELFMSIIKRLIEFAAKKAMILRCYVRHSIEMCMYPSDYFDQAYKIRCGLIYAIISHEAHLCPLFEIESHELQKKMGNIFHFISFPACTHMCRKIWKLLSLTRTDGHSQNLVCGARGL